MELYTLLVVSIMMENATSQQMMEVTLITLVVSIMMDVFFWPPILSFICRDIRGTAHWISGSDLEYDEYDTEGGNSTYLADVEEFVEETGTWKPAKSLDGERGSYGGVAVTKDLVCGWDGSVVESTNSPSIIKILGLSAL